MDVAIDNMKNTIKAVVIIAVSFVFVWKPDLLYFEYGTTPEIVYDPDHGLSQATKDAIATVKKQEEDYKSYVELYNSYGYDGDPLTKERFEAEEMIVYIQAPTDKAVVVAREWYDEKIMEEILKVPNK